jgi:hypothetical protein
MDAKMKGMIMSGMMALCLILGIMAALGNTWLVPEDDEDMDGGYSLTAMHMDMEEDGMCDLMVGMMDGGECDGSVLTWSFSDACETTEEDDPCDMATGGMMGTIGMWAGIVCALMVTLMLVLPMAGIDAMDAMPDMGKMITSWGAGGLMLLGIIGWWMMLPSDGEMAMGMSGMMGIGAALLGLAAAAMDQFMPADE